MKMFGIEIPKIKLGPCSVCGDKADGSAGSLVDDSTYYYCRSCYKNAGFKPLSDCSPEKLANIMKLANKKGIVIR